MTHGATWLKAIAAGVLLIVAALCVHADPPWWSSRGVIEDQYEEADNAPLVLGQLKWMATNACDELEFSLPTGAGTTAWATVRGFAETNDFSPVLVGQLKSVAAGFYDKLITVGCESNYPWTAVSNDDRDGALANIGQLKYLFDFNLNGPDIDSDSIPDWWEVYFFGSVTNQAGTDDFDGDELVNSQEWFYRANPTVVDTDGDGVSDGEEHQRQTDPRDSLSVNTTLYANYALGNDTNSGSSPDHNDGVLGPKKTVGAAIAATINGDHVDVAAGTYEELPETFHLGGKSILLISRNATLE